MTRYRTWKGPNKETLDGTNNACERAIGWWIKERYRTMRGDIVPANALKVSRLAGPLWQLPQTGRSGPRTLAQVRQASPAGSCPLFPFHLYLPTIERPRLSNQTETNTKNLRAVQKRDEYFQQGLEFGSQPAEFPLV